MDNISNLEAPTVNTGVVFWPSMIDLLTSVLMVFMIIYFVQYYLTNENLEAVVAEQRRDEFKTLFERQFIGERDISLTSELSSLRITFGEGVLFKRNEYQLLPRGKDDLIRLARVLNTTRTSSSRERSYKEIQIEGHTDPDALSRSTYPHDNWELSTARALEVLKFLTRDVAPPLDETVMSANGYASNRPAPGGKEQSRRIEILIFFSGKEDAGKPKTK